MPPALELIRAGNFGRSNKSFMCLAVKRIILSLPTAIALFFDEASASILLNIIRTYFSTAVWLIAV